MKRIHAPPKESYNRPEGYEKTYVYFTKIQFTRKHKDATRGILGMPLYELQEGLDKIRIWAGPDDTRCSIGTHKAFKDRLGGSRRLKLKRKTQRNKASLVKEVV